MLLTEARRAKIQEKSYTNDSKTEIDIDLFIRLFSNHYYLTTKEDIKGALVALGFPPIKERSGLPPYYRSEQFIRFLMTEGDKNCFNQLWILIKRINNYFKFMHCILGESFKVNEYPICLKTLYGEQEMIPDDSTYTPYESMSSDTLYGEIDKGYDSSDYLGSGSTKQKLDEGLDFSSDDSGEEGEAKIGEPEEELKDDASGNSSDGAFAAAPLSEFGNAEDDDKVGTDNGETDEPAAASKIIQKGKQPPSGEEGAEEDEE